MSVLLQFEDITTQVIEALGDAAATLTIVTRVKDINGTVDKWSGSTIATKESKKVLKAIIVKPPQENVDADGTTSIRGTFQLPTSKVPATNALTTALYKGQAYQIRDTIYGTGYVQLVVERKI